LQARYEGKGDKKIIGSIERGTWRKIDEQGDKRIASRKRGDSNISEY